MASAASKLRTRQLSLFSYTRSAIALSAVAVLWSSGAWAESVRLPILAPTSGILALEGASQRDGALLALSHAPKGVRVERLVLDTGSSPQRAVQAFEKAVRGALPVAISAPIFGPEMLAIMPLAKERKVPLVTISGTAKITELGNPYVFRFFPGDAVVKTAQARYTVEELKRKKVALVYQTTAYGQSGRTHLRANFKKLGAKIVLEEGLSPRVKDMTPVLVKLKRSGADVLVLQLHSGPTALIVKQAASLKLGLPIVAGSAMHQPSTAALLQPLSLKGVCAESGSSPVSGGSEAMRAFATAFQKRFGRAPDAFAAAQYDGVTMVLQAVAAGARTAADVRKALASGRHDGLAMTYKSDGKGNMAHDAVIVCYDGKSRVPAIVKRYRNVDGAL
jgi:branched-chain amino acid transport system substrate-binding protein